MPFYLSDTFGHSPLMIGNIMTAYPLLLALVGPFAGHWSDRFGSRLIMLLGLCGMVSGLFIFALFFDELPIVGIVTLLALIGTGMGLTASPTNSFIMQHVPVDYVGSIGGMIALSRNSGMVLGAALGLGMAQITFN